MGRTPRLFPNTVTGVINALQQTFWENAYADKVLETLFRENKKWGKRDRSFVAESTYGIVRYWRKLWFLLDSEPKEDGSKLYEIFGLWWLLQGQELPEWKEFTGLRDFNIQEVNAKLPQDTGVVESYPEWLDALAKKELKDAWPDIAKNLNLPALVSLRVNHLKTDKEKCLMTLEKEGVSIIQSEAFPSALFLEKRKNLKILESYLKGYYEVQDAGSQEITLFLNPMPNEVVIDACAGAGGKALHAADLMQNQGKIIAMDVYPRKLRELEKRAKRAGAKIIHTEEIPSMGWTATYKHKADKLLLDVPCSGTGVMRREPDTKWKLTAYALDEVIYLQQEILENYSQMVKPNGVMVYATCSILKSENEDQVQWFLTSSPEFTLEEEKRINPGSYSDGFYMARLRRK